MFSPLQGGSSGAILHHLENSNGASTNPDPVSKNIQMYAVTKDSKP